MSKKLWFKNDKWLTEPELCFISSIVLLLPSCKCLICCSISDTEFSAKVWFLIFSCISINSTQMLHYWHTLRTYRTKLTFLYFLIYVNCTNTWNLKSSFTVLAYKIRKLFSKEYASYQYVIGIVLRTLNGLSDYFSSESIR